MDVVHNPSLQAEGRRVVANATRTPWAFPDQQYDLFVALQVFEHLGTRQPGVRITQYVADRLQIRFIDFRYMGH
jgi:hypothetical protein